MALKAIGKASANERSSKVIEQGIQFLNSLHNVISYFGLSNNQIIAIDKTYLATSPFHKGIKHICPEALNPERLLLIEAQV